MPTMKLRFPLLTAALSLATLAPLSPVLAGGAGTPAAKPVTADAQTTKVVTAANAFLNTLSATQKNAVLFAWSDTTQRKNWSNFPLGGPGANRKGVRWGELNAAQRAALMTLLGTVLSPSGVDMVKGQMLADDLIRATDQGQGPAGAGGPPASGGARTTAGPAAPPAAAPAGGPPAGNRPQVSFGSEYYFVSFVGTPSATSPWMLQFGGHHLAINATVVGPNITLSPSLTGGEPIKVSFNTQTYTLVPNVPVEAQAAFALLQSLTPAQRTKAVVSTTRTDLVLGPGQDGKTLQPEGLPGRAMTAAQKTQFLVLIKDRLGILNADDLAAKMSVIQKNLDQTYFAWFGPTTSAGAAYHRVTGPSVIIEFSPQANDGDPANHLHNMYRDPTNEYGAAWTTLK
ncbi:DUF3500 domain-containing protein [Deinococcus ruber]|uniref:DUF3500 domain-containing protein n=1 Tax=Deinococcus ruber TaxID=1848197 RepID=A0A918FGM1_9DEIO|nr:DUF3500 domain-containing protein [Deinococcus ruber]GGR36518.1 hypothetical protein GCM10008957_52740 [Deinococcus ruber]